MRTALWTDLDLDRRLILLKEHKTARTQKEYEPRIIPLVDEVVSLLLAIRQREPDTTHIFVTARGRSWGRNSIQQKLRRPRGTAGLAADVTLYGLRHHFGARAIENDVNVKSLAQLLGQKTSRMAEHYVHLGGSLTHLADAMRRANARRSDA